MRKIVLIHGYYVHLSINTIHLEYENLLLKNYN